jgi:hypothetical protein
MKLLMAAAAGLLITVASSQFAFSSEWVFCVAPSNQERKIYITYPLFTNSAGSAMERDFRRFLEDSGLRHDGVQCPISEDEQSVRSMRQHADDFNQQRGMKVIPLDWGSAISRWK